MFMYTLAKFLKFMSHIDGAKIAAIKERCFGELLEIQCHTPKDICTWLVDNFNSTHSYIQLEGGLVLLVISEDVAKALEIPEEGPMQVEDARDGKVESEPHYSKKKKYKQHGVVDKLISMDVGNEFKMLFVVSACGCLFTPTIRAEIKANLWECLQSTLEAAKFNWAEFIRDDLCNKLLNMHSNIHKNVRGCILFLLVS